MTTTRNVSVNGVTYQVTDHDTGSGLTLDQAEQIIRNLASQADFGKMNSDLAGSSNSEDRTVKISLDDPEAGGTNTGVPTDINGNIVNPDLEIHLKSSDFAEGEIYRTKSGAPAQKTVDQALAHELAHIHDYRIRGTDIRGKLPGESDADYYARRQAAEDYAEARENEHLKESGRPERDRFDEGPNQDDDVRDYNEEHANTPVPSPNPSTSPGEPIVMPQGAYPKAPKIGSDSTENPEPDPIEQAKDKVGAAENAKDPLVLDLDHSGTIDLISLAGSTGYFDHDGDGFAEATGLVAAEDGYLTIDLNDNGVVDAGELFGTDNLNGLAALRQYDLNKDDVIDAEDVVWDDLIVWQDHNENGYSDFDELYTLADHDIVALNLTATEVSSTNQGHSVTHTGTFTYDAGSGATNYAMHNVAFQYNNVNTVYVGGFEMLYDAAVLPIDQRGYGILPSLYVAMCMDYEGTGNLLDLVTGFSELTFGQIFDGTTDTADAVKDIMFRWAGVDGVSPTSRGSYVDARELGFLEALADNPFLQGGHQPNPMYNASIDVNNAFKEVFNHIYANLTTQGAGGELFEGNWYYDPASGVIEGVTGLDLTRLSDLETEATGLANTATRQTFWENVVRMIDGVVGVTNLDAGDLAALQAAITDSDAALDLEDDILPALAVDDLPFGSGSDQTVTGSSGIDNLFGYAGNDLLQGMSGNDIMTGGADSDVLEGGLGDDTYVYQSGDGDDVIVEYDGADTISFGTGIDSGDITLTRMVDDLKIDIDNGTDAGTVYVAEFFKAADTVVETILFNDTSTINLTALNWSYTGTSGADVMNGARWNTGDVDTIYGNGGNDRIYGYDGADTLYGGDGHDHIEGGDDNDTVYGDAGNDTLEGNAGNDHLYDGTGDDEASGGTGDDVYHYGGGHDTYIESSGTDSIVLASGIASASTVYYRIGNDMQIVFDTNNTITIPSFFSASGPKIETLDFYADADVNLTTVSTITQGDSGNNTLNGTASADYLYGNGGNDTVNGNSGNDFLYGGTGNDTITGGNGNDWLEGGAGNDDMQGGADADTYLFTSGLDTIYDISGTDELRFIEGWAASDLTFARNFGALNDMVITINGSNAITITDQFTSARQIETIRFYDNSTMTLTGLSVTTHGNSSANTISGVLYGGSLNDIIYGYGGNDTLNGGDGDDMLYGGDGDDTLNGNDGNDLLDGGAGNDTISGGAQNDIIVYSSGLDVVKDVHGGTDTLRMGSGIDVNAISFSNVSSYDTKITVTASVDEVTVENLRSGTTNYRIEFVEFADGFVTSLHDYASWVNGTSGNDLIAYTSADETILGKAGNDTITAGGGADDVHGGSGNDDISGDGGNDLLHGGDGDDILKGGDGLDTLYGGAGADAFVFQTASAFNNIDVIKDFDVANDVIDLTDVLGSYDPLTDLITDWVEITTSGSDTVLKVDRDGTGGTYSLVQIATIQGITGLTNEEALVSGGQLLVA